MSRRSLIICLAVLAAMILGVGVAVAVLYSDSDKTKTERRSAVPDQERYMLLPAIPADAVLVACMSDLKDLSSSAFSGFPFTAALADSVSSGGFRSIASSRIAMSMHFSGKLQTLYVFDVGKASSDPSADASSLAAFARKHGLSATYEEFQEYAGALAGGADGELSEDELEQVAGGKGSGAWGCFIVGAGGGSTSSNDWCMVFGLGMGICVYEGASAE